MRLFAAFVAAFFATCLGVDAGAQATRVQLEAPGGARLERRAEGEQWETVCMAPCEAAVGSGSDFRVTGGGIRASAPFTLQGGPGEHEKLRVDAASKGQFVTGIVMLSVGAAAVFFPLVFLMGDIVMQQSEGGVAPPSSGELAACLGTAGAGAITGGIGLALLLTNRRTTISQEVVGARSPSWKLLDRAALGSSFVAIPIIQGAF